MFRISLLILLCATHALAQGKLPATNRDSIYTLVDSSACFPTGNANLNYYIITHLRYPPKTNDVQGRVFVSFVVERDGSLTNFNVLRGMGNGYDEEAIKVLAFGPKWLPGIKDGKAVRQRYVIPVAFGQAPVITGANYVLPGEKDAVYTRVDHPARFPGRPERWQAYLDNNVRYPVAARAKNQEGRVVLLFIVEKDGVLSHIRLSHALGSGCDEEAIRVLTASPKWIPARQDGHIVRSEQLVSIRFSWRKEVYVR